MRESEPRGVQRLPVESLDGRPQRRRCSRGQLAPSAVHGIADDRIPDVREMHTDLMRAAGLETNPREGVRSVLLLDAVVSDRRSPIAAHGHLGALRAMASDVLVDGAATG